MRVVTTGRTSPRCGYSVAIVESADLTALKEQLGIPADWTAPAVPADHKLRSA
jgi:hypothetical protein